MRENLSAPGNISDWLDISKEALINLNYYNITQDPQYARLSARYGYDDYILVNIRTKDPEHVLLEFDVSSPKMIQQFKTASAQLIRQKQQEFRNKQESESLGPAPSYNAPEVENLMEDDSSAYTVPDYQAEDGDYIERTRYFPDDTLQLKEYRKELDRLESDSLKHQFRQRFDKLWIILLSLVLVPPLGIFLLWYFHRTKIITRILLTVVAFLYFVLIWIGFFGIDTGFNRESIQMFYTNQQYKITRFFNQFNNETDTSGAETGDEVPAQTTSDDTSEGGFNIGDFFNGIVEDMDNFFNRDTTPY